MKKTLTTLTLTALLIGAGLGMLVEKRWGIGDRLPGKDAERYSSTAEPGVPDEYKGRLKIFILAGQSNMVGYADIPRGKRGSDRRLYLFGNDYRWQLADEPLDDPSGQVDLVSRDEFVGMGPGIAFAASLLENDPDMAIGLVPCARGGTFLREWRRDMGDETLYGSCLKRARAASTMGEIAGVLFFQGEWDALNQDIFPQRRDRPEYWREQFSSLVEGLRRDLNQQDLPIVFAQIGKNHNPSQFKNWELVQEEQRQVVIPGCSMITTSDLNLADEVHFTSESYEAIGRRFAQAYQEIVNKSKISIKGEDQ